MFRRLCTVLALLVVLAACGNDDDTPSPPVASTVLPIATATPTETSVPATPTSSATLTAAEPYLPCGTFLMILGDGFEPDSVVTLVERMDDGRVIEFVEGRADDDGFFPAQFAPHEGDICRDPSLGLDGREITIEAVVEDVTLASVLVTIYPLHSLPALEVSDVEAGCGEVVTLHGVNFDPGTEVTVWLNPSRDPQPTMVVDGVQVGDDGGFVVDLETNALSACELATIDAPQEHVIRVGTDRAGQETLPSSYPAQRTAFTLLPTGE